MQKNQIQLSLLFLLIVYATYSILISCSSNNNKIKYHISSIEKQILRDSSNGENFNSFLEHFRQDTLFQIERNIVPFVYKWEIVQINAKGDLADTMYLLSDRTALKSSDWNWKQPTKFVFKPDTVNLFYSTTEEFFEFITIEYFVKINSKWFYDSKLTEFKNERRL